MSCFKGNLFVFTGIIFWPVVVFRATDGGSITWFEPPPFETVTDVSSISAANSSVVKGYINEELSCNFSLSADLKINTVFMKLDGSSVATFVPGQQAPTVSPSYVNRFNATWVPNQLTLILLNVTAAEEGEYVCEVASKAGSIQTWVRKIHVSLLVEPIITEITGNIVREGGNVTLNCSGNGKPAPSFKWTRLSDNHAVTMPLININRHDARDYRCTADNGVGIPATKDVNIDVQYPPEANDRVQNATVAGGVEHTFSCPVGGNPVPDITWYNVTETYRGKQFKTRQPGCYICVARNIHGISDNITQCLIINPSQTTVSFITLSQYPSQTTVSSITASQNPSQTTVSHITASQSPSPSSATARSFEPKAGPPWIIIIAVAGGVLVLAILVCVSTWWLHKQRKCRKDSKVQSSNLGRHDAEGGYSQVQGAYAQSGPPAANGTNGVADQEIEAAAAAAAIPTYAVVEKSKKKKKKLREEVPPVYAEVDKSKRKKKKVDDKNLYETLDEPKKARKPGELLYADLGDFQNPGMSPVSISPQPLPAIKIPEPYERTDYADITQFHKGNAKLPQNDGNEDTEMKPKRPSKKKIQGNDNETPI